MFPLIYFPFLSVYMFFLLFYAFSFANSAKRRDIAGKRTLKCGESLLRNIGHGEDVILVTTSYNGIYRDDNFQIRYRLAAT